ncbi:MAG: Rrf2 family transcriptional regulator [Candidatus Omnitrophota bacterium]
MKLTSRSEYALLALIYLARKNSAEPVTVEAIASAQGIPPKFLEQILLDLKRAKLLKSSKGQHGGFILSRRPNDICLAEVIRLFDGALAPTESASKYFYEPTPAEKEKKLIRLFRRIRDYISVELENAKLSDMC